MSVGVLMAYGLLLQGQVFTINFQFFHFCGFCVFVTNDNILF